MYTNYIPRKVSYKKDTRFVPFAGPFLLGALTGGVAVAAVGPRPRPYYGYPNNGYMPYPRPYPYYY